MSVATRYPRSQRRLFVSGWDGRGRV